MCRLLLFPEVPGNDSGYRIAVKADVERLSISHSDKLIFTSTRTLPEYLKGFDAKVLAPMGNSILRRVINILSGKIPNSFYLNCINKIVPDDIHYDDIFCGDVIFYDAIRKAYPHRRLHVRFHNLYTEVLRRKTISKITVDPRYLIMLQYLKRLEGKILDDGNCELIFITPEEEEYAKRIKRDIVSKTWKINDEIWSNCTPLRPTVRALVWYGGLSLNKEYFIKQFIRDTLPKIRKRVGNIPLHMFGRGSQRYNKPAIKIFGHGFITNDAIPMPDALHINPDLLGGGIKLKIGRLLRNGIAFISTPYGVEGYSIPNERYFIVKEINQWPEHIFSIYEGQTFDL